MKHTTNLWFLTVFLIVWSCSEPIKKPTADIGIIPRPAEISTGDSYFGFEFTSGIAIDTSNPELVKIANYLNDRTGGKQKITNQGKIRLEIRENPQLAEEGYELEIKKSSVSITANRPAGIFYGVQTLLQLLPPKIKVANAPDSKKEIRIPTLKITDQPQFSWRGIMLDVSRHWFAVEEVKRLIDQMAEYKLNVFHWHLTDDQGWRIEIPALPRLPR